MTLAIKTVCQFWKAQGYLIEKSHSLRMWIKHWKFIRAQKNVQEGDKDTEDSSTKTGMDKNVPELAHARRHNLKKKKKFPL